MKKLLASFFRALANALDPAASREPYKPPAAGDLPTLEKVDEQAKGRPIATPLEAPGSSYRMWTPGGYL